MVHKAAYAELRCRSNFSFLTGASHPEELVDRAAELGLSALALTDLDGLYGAVRAHMQAKKRGIPLIVGSEVTCGELGPEQHKSPLVLLAMDREGYGRLCRLLTRAHQDDPPGIPFCVLAEQTKGLFALYPGVDGEIAALLREAFGRRVGIAVSRHHVAGEEVRIAASRSIGKRLSIPVVVTNDVVTHHRRRQTLQDVLTCIRLGITVNEAGRRLLPNAERTLKGPEEMARLWSDFPEGLENAFAIAESCGFRLDEIGGEHPLPEIGIAKEPDVAPPIPSEREGGGEVAGMALLSDLVRAGASARYGDEIPEDVACQIARELSLIEQLGYASYFLTVWDIVRFARSRSILCQGRGSAANSVVCYLLGITSIDPVRMELLFERFISVERGEPPDIDVDFEHERREEVIQYVYEKYGRDHAGMVAEVITYRPKSAQRDVTKALGPNVSEEMCQKLVNELLGFPRHLSIHVGGFAIARHPLCETVPIQPATMPNRTIVQWDKDDLADLGILKVDLLGLGMMSALSRCFGLLAQFRPTPASPTAVPHPDSLASIPPEDPAVYEMISRADTVGVFQIESRAQMSLLPRLEPRNFYDLVVSVAIIRPGPIQGGMVHPYLRRRDGLEKVHYPYPPLEPVLKKTFGVPLFQEQAMRLAVIGAGFTPGEADELRRFMTHKRSHEKMGEMKVRLLAGMAERNISQADAEAIYKQLLGFTGYGFPESHAASFALLVYASAWIKRYHPAVFACALLNSQPMGFYAPHTLVEDAKRHGIEVRGVDVCASDWECILEDWVGPVCPSVRIGLSSVRGLPRAVGEAVAAARRQGTFGSVGDLACRARLTRAWLSRLAEAGALRSLAPSRREALWRGLGLPLSQEDLFAGKAPEESAPLLPEATAAEEILADYSTTGLSERAHPMSILRPALAERDVCSARELLGMDDRARVSVAGLVIARQRPETGRGIVFMSLEDETGIANLVVMPEVYERFRTVMGTAPLIRAEGRVERAGKVVNVRVGSVEPLSLLEGLHARSRDFH